MTWEPELEELPPEGDALISAFLTALDQRSGDDLPGRLVARYVDIDGPLQPLLDTLRRWDRRFLAQRDAVHALGFDDLFMRVWHFYLAYSQAGFASGYINVSQLTFTREDQ